MQNTPFAEYFADLLENMGSSDMSESPLASLGDSPNEKLPIHHATPAHKIHLFSMKAPH